MRSVLEHRNIFLSRLSQNELALFAGHLAQLDMRIGDYLHRAGERIDHVVFPTEGLVAITVGTGGHPTVEAAVVGREGVVGGMSAAADLPAMSDAQIRVPGRAYRIAAAAFREALDTSSRLRSLVQRCESTTLAQIQQSAVCNATHSVEARICRWLLEIHDRCQSHRLPLTQDALAQMIGVRRTTVTLVAARLQGAGAFRCRRGYVHITNRELVERHSCACYSHTKTFTSGLFPERPISTPLPQRRLEELPSLHASSLAER